MAIACLRFVTFLPVLPLFNVPRFFLCIARSTSREADLEYLRAISELLFLHACKPTTANVSSRATEEARPRRDPPASKPPRRWRKKRARDWAWKRDAPSPICDHAQILEVAWRTTKIATALASDTPCLGLVWQPFLHLCGPLWSEMGVLPPSRNLASTVMAKPLEAASSLTPSS